MESERPSQSSTSGSSLLCEEGNFRQSKHRRVDNRLVASYMRPKIIAAVLVLLLVVSLAVNVFLIVFTLVKMTESSQQHGDASRDTTSQLDSEASTPVCVLCPELGLPFSSASIPTGVTVERVDVPGGQEKLCCQRYPSYLNTLIKMLLVKTWGPDGGHAYHVAPSGPSDVRMPLPPGPSAHLYLASPPSLHNNNPAFGLRWTQQMGYGTAHLHGNVSVDETTGGLRVPKKGVYFLYSFMSLRQREGTPLSLAHYVYRTHPNLPKSGRQYLLLDRMEGEGKIDRGSFLCANLMLRKGDVITVNVSDVTHLQDTWHSSFMGLHLLS